MGRNLGRRFYKLTMMEKGWLIGVLHSQRPYLTIGSLPFVSREVLAHHIISHHDFPSWKFTRKLLFKVSPWHWLVFWSAKGEER